MTDQKTEKKSFDVGDLILYGCVAAAGYWLFFATPNYEVAAKLCETLQHQPCTEAQRTMFYTNIRLKGTSNGEMILGIWKAS